MSASNATAIERFLVNDVFLFLSRHLQRGILDVSACRKLVINY